MRPSTLLLLTTLFWGPVATAQDATAQDTTDPLTRADAAWHRRAEGHVDGQAAPGPIGEAVAAYEEALAADPTHLETTWKLLRALYFQGDHTTEGNEAKKKVFGRGREVSEAALNLLAERIGTREALDTMEPEAFLAAFREPEVPRIYFWATANWGLWGQAYGKMAAARQGVATRVRDYSEIVIALDPEYEDGGGYRILGRLHTEAPKIPFITGWIDHKGAILHLRRAFELGSEDPYNRFYLADALLRFDKRQEADAMKLLRQVAKLTPRPEKVIEDLFVRQEAQALLAKTTK
jgi:tetratricopeptide (TPR) repeat protein